jgi:hypothetical protein
VGTLTALLVLFWQAFSKSSAAQPDSNQGLIFIQIQFMGLIIAIIKQKT